MAPHRQNHQLPRPSVRSQVTLPYLCLCSSRTAGRDCFCSCLAPLTFRAQRLTPVASFLIFGYCFSSFSNIYLRPVTVYQSNVARVCPPSLCRRGSRLSLSENSWLSLSRVNCISLLFSVKCIPATSLEPSSLILLLHNSIMMSGNHSLIAQSPPERRMLCLHTLLLQTM